jgi:hypothetical protein
VSIYHVPRSSFKNSSSTINGHKRKEKKNPLSEDRTSVNLDNPQILSVIELTTGKGTFWPTKCPTRVDCQRLQPCSNMSRGGFTMTCPESRVGGENCRLI